MGMTIDESIDYLSNENTRLKLSASDKDAIDRIISAYLITKANYNERLKADMVVMLEDLKSEFEEYEPKWAENEDQVIASNRTWDDFDNIIQQKINNLKEDENEKR